MITLLTLLESLPRHLGWWFQALVRWRDPRAPMNLRRLLLLVFGFPLFLLLQGMHAVCLLLDELFFPAYRRVDLGRALFITGIPRSGTTFLHRTLASDTERYTTITTWEAILAPSITQRRVIGLLAWLDARLGGFAGRGLAVATRRLTGSLEDIHEVGLEAAEEDYLALLPAGGCFILLLAFPAAPGLQALGHLDRRMPEGRRRRLLRFHHRCLQRHLYADGGRRRLLSKNAAFGSWVAGLAEEHPQAQFILCIREPLAALSSQISAIGDSRRLFGTGVDAEPFQRMFLDQFEQTLDHMATTVANWPAERAAIVDMADLRADPASVITAAMARLRIAPGELLRQALADLPKGSRSRHQHDVAGLRIPKAELEARLRPPYHRLLELPQRIRISN